MRVTRRALGELLLVSLASIHVAKAEVVVFGSFSHPPPLTPQQQQDDDGPIQSHIDSARHACAVDVALHCNAGPADDFVDQFFGSSDPFMNLFGGPMMMMPAGLTMTMEREENNDPFGRRIEQKSSNVMRQNQEANNDPIGTLLDEMMDTAIRMHSDPVAAVAPPTIVVEGSWSSSPSALDDLDMLFDSMLNGLFERVASASNSASADGAAEEKEEEEAPRREEETSEGSAQPFSMSGWDPKLFSKRVVEHGKAVLEQAKGATNEEEVVSEEQQPELRNRLARRLTEVTDEVFFPLEDGSILVVAAAPSSQTTEEEREAEEQARLPSLGFGCGGDRCLWTLHDTAETFGHRPILSGACRDALENVKHSLRRLRQPMEQQPQHHNTVMTWTQLEQEQLEENVNRARRERLESILTFEVAVVLLTLSALLLLRLVLFLHRRNSHGHHRGGRFGRMSSDKRRLKRRIMQAVYSNPTLKAQVEDAVGEELGNLPPLAPRALRFVGSSSAGSERGGCLSCFHVLCHSLPLFSLMGLLCITSVTNPDAVILIGGPALVLLGLYKCCVCFFCARQDYSNDDDVECKCCCCGTSTSDVTPDTVNKCSCNCCHGTGVCSPSCQSCCEGGGDDDDAIVTSANNNTDEEGNCCKCCCCGTSASDVATGIVGDCNCQCCHGSGVCSTDCASCGGRNGGYVSVSSSGNVGPVAMAGYPGARRSVNSKAAYVGVPVQVV